MLDINSAFEFETKQFENVRIALEKTKYRKKYFSFKAKIENETMVITNN